jgi:hypothetical protein
MNIKSFNNNNNKRFEKNLKNIRNQNKQNRVTSVRATRPIPDKPIVLNQIDQIDQTDQIDQIDIRSIVVYTAISNNYDELKENSNFEKNGLDFVAFLDDPIESETWEFRQINSSFEDQNRNAKIHKVLSHLYFPDKEYSLWMDGSFSIKNIFSVEELIKTYLKDCDLAVFKHPRRNCVYEEAKTCIEKKLDDPIVILNQIEKYMEEGYSYLSGGLQECGIILRRHTDQIKEFNENWWEEIKNGSKRDQISFPYVVKKMNLKINYFTGFTAKNDFFHNHGH